VDLGTNQFLREHDEFSTHKAPSPVTETPIQEIQHKMKEKGLDTGISVDLYRHRWFD
jgi:hypothetical protein